MKGDSTPPGEPIPAAMYVSTCAERDPRSTDNQADVIRQYADRHGYRIIETFVDEGKSGRSLDGREGLQRLIDTVRSGKARFRAILIYDVTRWGRFQDIDKNAHYEYLCRRAGIKVDYCADPFANGGTPMEAVMKAMKRAMAAEYSRELSTKVFQRQCRLVQLGFRQGGKAGFGLRRMLLDLEGNAKGTLRIGEQKLLKTDRVVLIPGPDDEVDTVRWIFRAFVDEGRREADIAEALNARGLLTDLGRPWTCGTVRQILSNEKYIGNNVFNRLSAKLTQKARHNPPEKWVRKDGAFDAIVDRAMYHRAQGIIRDRAGRFRDVPRLEPGASPRERIRWRNARCVTGGQLAAVIDEVAEGARAPAPNAALAKAATAQRGSRGFPRAAPRGVATSPRESCRHPRDARGGRLAPSRDLRDGSDQGGQAE